MAKDVKFKITAVDKTARAFKSVSRGLGSMAKKVVSLQGAIVALGAGAVIKSAIDQFSDFEQAIVDVGKVSDISIGDLLDQIEQLPKELGSSTEMVQAFYQAVSAGVADPVRAMDLVTTAAKASKAAHVDQGETIKALTKLMAGFGDEIESTESAADLLFKIEKLGQTQFAELVPEVGKLAALSKSMGVTAEEMGGAWAQITQFAGSTAQAATQYEAIIGSLMKPTKAMTDLLADYGGAQKAIAELGFAGVLAKIQEETGGVSEALGGLLGRKEATSAFLALAKNDFEALNEKIAEMGDRSGTMEAAFNRWQGTFAAVKEKFMNTIGSFMIRFGEQMMPEVMDAMDAFAFWLEDNQDMILGWFRSVMDAGRELFETIRDKWPEAKKVFMQVKQALEDLAPVVFRVSQSIFTFLDKLLNYFDKVSDRRASLAAGQGLPAFDTGGGGDVAGSPVGESSAGGLIPNSEFFGGAKSMGGGGTVINIERSVSPSEVIDISQEQTRRDNRF